MSKKATDKEIQEMFQEGNLIARSILVSSPPNGSYKMEEIGKEIGFLHAAKIDGEHKNVERLGQRNRSATLLVPGVDIELMTGVGFLYDADKTTIRAYMLKDSGTQSPYNHTGYYNINQDKESFQPVISKKEFMETYKQYRNDPNVPAEAHHGFKYNEILANFFPESLTGLVMSKDTPENKLKLLTAKQFLSTKHDLDLPMVIINEGKVQTWTPDMAEVRELVNLSRDKISALKKVPDDAKKLKLENFVQDLGFSLKIKDFNQEISPQDIVILNKNEFSKKEVINFLHDLTAMPKGGKFTYGIEGRLMEVVNNRLESEGLSKVNSLDNVILHKQDVKNLVSMLDKELGKKDKSHKQMDSKDLDKFSDHLAKEIKEPKLDQSSKMEIKELKQLLSRHKSENFVKIKEFFNKVKSLFDEKVITRKIAPVNKNQGQSR
jgi:hypothetical protein